jgi:hypothetical protein
MNWCLFCDYLGNDVTRHAIKHHSGHPFFFLVCNICGGMWKKYESFKKHVNRKHTCLCDILPVVNFQNDLSDVGSPVSMAASHAERADILENQFAEQCSAYLLRLKSVHRLLQTCISDIIAQTNEIMQTATSFTREKVRDEAKVNTNSS